MTGIKRRILFKTWLRDKKIGPGIEGRIIKKLKEIPDFAEVVLLAMAHGECEGAPKDVKPAALRLIVRFREAGGSPKPYHTVRDPTVMTHFRFNTL